MPIRVVMFGIGRIGGGVARLLLERGGFEIVGAVCGRPENDGRDLGEILGLSPLGVVARQDADEVLSGVEADVAVHATRPHLDYVEAELTRVLEAGLNVVTLTEEAAFPWNSHPETSGRLDRVARDHNVSLVGTGVNPGFMWDTLLSVFSTGFAEVTEIRIGRRPPLDFLSSSTHAQMGVNLTPAEFDAAVERGEVVGHVGTRQSLEMLGASLGWRLESFEESLSATVNGETPAPGETAGRVNGFRQLATATFDGGRIEVVLEPRLEPEETYDEITFVGRPTATLRISPALEAVSTAHAVAANVVPLIIDARPGLRTMLELPLPSAKPAWSGGDSGVSDERAGASALERAN